MDLTNKPDYKSYKKAIKEKAIQSREIEEEFKQSKIKTDSALRAKFHIPPKQRVTKQEVMRMLLDVLETDNKGMAIIEAIAVSDDKNKLWVGEVSDSNCKKLLIPCLSELEQSHPLIALMKKNGTYSKTEITSKKLVVALNKLRKQKQLCLNIDKLKQRIEELEQLLKTRCEINDWKPEAIRLKAEENLSYGDIAKRLNKAKSTVSSYLNKIACNNKLGNTKIF